MPPGWSQKGAAGASTTASAPGSRSRCATSAAACSASAPARCAEQGAKYVNSAEGELFHKGRPLFGIDLAKRCDREGRAGRCVAEGYTDVLALHQAGMHEASG